MGDTSSRILFLNQAEAGAGAEARQFKPALHSQLFDWHPAFAGDELAAAGVRLATYPCCRRHEQQDRQ
jgi:hypothetical protein